MFDSAFITGLKQSNISVDAEKSKERVAAIWKEARVAQKQAVRNLADIAATTVYRVYNTGSLSIKLALALAQTLNVNPLYLTGASDERGEYTDEAARELLIKHKYEKVLAEYDKSQKRSKRAERSEEQQKVVADKLFEQFEEQVKGTIDEVVAEYVETPVIEAIVESVVVVEQSVVSLPEEDLSEETLDLLIKALRIRAQYSANAKKIYVAVKELLLG
ncbi:MAG: hypothetical protein LBN30_03260 [Oscillospiraceae bacterium]|jgi:hypothetical protein|nr:hypothetical protein [Oscillospiraceae bacterium]